MGIRDFFRRRRERESAIPPGALEELNAGLGEDRPAAPPGPRPGRLGGGAARRASGPGGGPELPGADAAGLGELIRRAATTGQPQVTTESHMLDGGGPGVAEEILAILSAYGAAPRGGARRLDSDQLAALRRSVLESLREQGLDEDLLGGSPGEDRDT